MCLIKLTWTMARHSVSVPSCAGEAWSEAPMNKNTAGSTCACTGSMGHFCPDQVEVAPVAAHVAGTCAGQACTRMCWCGT